MNKYIFILIASLLSFMLMGCEDKDDLNSVDLHLLDGVWEVVDNGTQDVFERGCLLEISTFQDQENTGFGGMGGCMTTFYQTAGGGPLRDKIYNWNIRYMENHQPLLDLVLQDEVDSDDLWAGNYYYTITRLTNTHMWWRGRSNGDSSVIKFMRRPAIE